MTIFELFSKFTCPKKDDNILLLTHTDLDGSGAAILLAHTYPNLTIQHCSNRCMSFDIKNAVCNPEESDKYDWIFVCDISCTAEDAIKIQNNPNHKKLILIDHHATAMYLNKYTWACVQSDITDDSFRMKYYVDYPDSIGKSSGTSLVYDFLEYFDMITPNNFPLMQPLVHLIASWDTWDWYNVFDRNPTYKNLDTLFEIYGSEKIEAKLLLKLNDPHGREIIDETDEFLLSLEQHRINKYLESISKCINTGNIEINGTIYSCVFCSSNQYMTDTFDYMTTEYPDYDLYFVNYSNGISFRARKEEINVGEILTPLGGGGHEGAGGMRIPFELQTDYIEKALNATLYVDKKTYN